MRWVRRGAAGCASARAALGLAATAMLAAACGTTVSGADVASQGGAAASGGLSVPGATGGSGAPTGAAGGAGTATAGNLGVGGAAAGGAAAGGAGEPAGATAGAGGTAPAAGGPANGGGVTPGRTLPSSAPGVTPTAIYVGMVYAVNSDALNKAAGANNLTAGDTKADGNAIVDDINAHGGIAGRKVVPVWQPFDSTSTATVDQQWASICAHFTQDKPRVFAVLGQGVASYRACIARAGVVELDADLPDISDQEFAQYPTLVELGYPRLSRVAQMQVDSLAAQGYFSGWNSALGAPGSGKAKVGVITYDDPAYNGPVSNVLIPGLRRLGYDPGADVARITPVRTASDYGNQAASVQSAVLRFAADHVTHVVDFEGNGGLALFFMNEAESQHYHPRYGVNSTTGLQALVSAGDVQKDQATGAMGFGWIPSFDVTPDRNPDNGPYSNPERRHCIAVFKAHGITFADTNAEGVGLEYCANLYLLRFALDATPKVITPSTFVDAVNAIGWSYDPAGSLGSFLGAGRHDGASKGYYMQWYGDCGCMKYDGPLRTIPG